MDRKEFEQEIEKRIGQVETKDNGVIRMTKRDYIIASVITGICLFFVVLGAFI